MAPQMKDKMPELYFPSFFLVSVGLQRTSPVKMTSTAETSEASSGWLGVTTGGVSTITSRVRDNSDGGLESRG